MIIFFIFCSFWFFSPFFQGRSHFNASHIYSTAVMRYGLSGGEDWWLIRTDQQELYQMRTDSILKKWPISSALKGVGSDQGSQKTPPGWHRIARKIGDGLPSGTILKGRQSTGKLATIIHEPVDVAEDHVTSRILWLTGLEPGINQGKRGDVLVDSYQRYIYIHGTHEEGLIGKPASHGCIRMMNADVIELYGQAKEGALVFIFH